MFNLFVNIYLFLKKKFTEVFEIKLIVYVLSYLQQFIFTTSLYGLTKRFYLINNKKNIVTNDHTDLV